jgi:polysaccharide export outer membrane protein
MAIADARFLFQPGKLACWALITCLCLPHELAAQEQPGKAHDLNYAAPLATPLGEAPDSSVRLGVGDLLEISVYNVPELTSKARISSNGDVYLPLVNYVHVVGLTAEEAERLLEKRLAEGGFVKNPHVTVLVDESVSQSASILGEVARPGIYPIVGEQRLFDVISAAGGLTEKAGRSITLTHRGQPDAPTTISVSRNLADNPGSNVPVLAGDTIIVRKADVVYVVGDVGRPSGLLMESGQLTVLQAIALAGGTTRTAKLGAARIIRKGSNGISETPVPLKKILEAKAPDLPMQADDILFVPTSAGKAFAGHTLQAALQAAAAASVITVMP